MDKAKIFLEDGVENIVNCIFYLYNSKYYFLYTQNEVDENGYVRLYLTKVGKETINDETGPKETGNMVGIEVPTDDEWKEVQGSISKIVNSKKNKTDDKDIQILPLNMLVNLKVVGKKTFRLLSSIIEKDFGVILSEKLTEQNQENEQLLDDKNLDKPIEEENVQTIESVSQEINSVENVNVEEPQIADTVKIDPDQSVEETNQLDEELNQISNQNSTEVNEEYDTQDIIIDYRTKFFEEQEKNKRLTEEIENLRKKLESINEIINGN